MIQDNDNSKDDDGIFSVYNAQLIVLSGRASLDHVIDNPDATAKAVSPICGSEVTVMLKIAGDKVTDFGYEVEACALTKSVVGVMRNAIIGKTRREIALAGSELEDLLAGKPVLPTGDWAELVVLAPLKDYRARHNAMMLPFEAVEKAFSTLK